MHVHNILINKYIKWLFMNIYYLLRSFFAINQTLRKVTTRGD